MIAFACAVTDAAVYKRYAGRGFELVAEPDSILFVQAAAGSTVRIYNLLLEQAAACKNLEALVLLHEKAEILDPDFCSKLRRALNNPTVGVVGCAGASGVRSIAWWEGSVTWTSSIYRYEDLGGLELTALSPDGWNGREHSTNGRLADVDTVDGVMMGISPWAVRNIRFDESLGPHYGFDFDFCLQVRAAGRRIVVEDLKVAHYFPLAVIDDADTWIEAHMKAAEKWEGRFLEGEPTEIDWKLRARRAEAEATTGRLLSASKMYEAQALARAQERDVSAVTDTASWRITAPLRRLSALAKDLRRTL
jgi:Glycosyltransferase like family